MNRNDFKKISRQRVDEARSLLDDGHWPGAYYLIGYSVECALKVCVCNQVKPFRFPDKNLAKAYTHSLKLLIGLAGLDQALKKEKKSSEVFEVNWATVKDWNHLSRYTITTTEVDARDMFVACTGSDGILPWIKRQW